MAVTNPTKYVTVRRLNRFKEKMKAELAGPVYDEEEHGFTFPSGAKVSYDADGHGFVFG